MEGFLVLIALVFFVSLIVTAICACIISSQTGDIKLSLSNLNSNITRLINLLEPQVSARHPLPMDEAIIAQSEGDSVESPLPSAPEWREELPTPPLDSAATVELPQLHSTLSPLPPLYKASEVELPSVEAEPLAQNAKVQPNIITDQPSPDLEVDRPTDEFIEERDETPEPPQIEETIEFSESFVEKFEDGDVEEIVPPIPAIPVPPKPQEPSAFQLLIGQLTAPLKQAYYDALGFLMKEGHIWVAAGILVLLLGVAFFVRFSIERSLFPPEMRLASSSLLGLIIFTFGFRLRTARRAYALLLQSCGLGVMYLTVVGAVRLYQLLGSGLGLGLLTILVALTALMALWQEAQLLAHASLIAAFVAPLLISTGSSNYVGLFTFYVIINSGIWGMSLFRPWRRLYLTGFVLTFGIYALWAFSNYEQVMFTKAMTFLTIFYLFYAAIGLRLFAKKTSQTIESSEVDQEHNSELSQMVLTNEKTQPLTDLKSERRFSFFLPTDVTLTLLTPMVFLILAAYIGWRQPYVLAATAFSMGLIYMGLGQAFWHKCGPDGRKVIQLVLSQGLIYGNLALPLTFIDFKPELFHPTWLLGLVWALEGTYIYLAGLNSGQANRRIFGLFLVILAMVLGLANIMRTVSTIPLLSPQFFLTALVSTALVAMALGGLKNKDKFLDFEKKWPEYLTTTSVAWLLGLTSIEIARWAPTEVDLVTAMVLALSLQGLAWLAAGKIWPQIYNLRWGNESSLPPITTWPIIAPIAPAMVAVMPYLGALFNIYRWFHEPNYLETGAWVAFITLYISYLWVTQRQKSQNEKCLSLLWLTQPKADKFLTSWFTAVFLTGAIALGMVLSTWVANLIPVIWQWTGLALRVGPLSAVLIFCVYKKIKNQHNEPLYGGNVLPWLATFLNLWLFFKFSFYPGAQGAYLPLLNQVDIIQLFLVIPAAFWIYTYLHQLGNPKSFWALYGLGLSVFLWLNLVVARLVHHWVGVAYNLTDIWGSDIFQSLAAFTWAAAGIAAMINGYRAKRRPQWLMGAIVIIIDCLKLFFIDLSQSDTLTRIISFIFVGLFLILVGYFAPLPPKKIVLTTQEEE